MRDDWNSSRERRLVWIRRSRLNIAPETERHDSQRNRSQHRGREMKHCGKLYLKCHRDGSRLGKRRNTSNPTNGNLFIVSRYAIKIGARFQGARKKCVNHGFDHTEMCIRSELENFIAARWSTISDELMPSFQRRFHNHHTKLRHRDCNRASGNFR